jgi:peroxiredoxin
MTPLGTSAPDFRLPDTDGKQVSLATFADAPALLVAFICNHCPFVKHIQGPFAQLAREYQGKGVAVVAINSNDVANHPEDSPAKMVEERKTAGYTFPYLYDESQKVAQAYRAACTPDFFLFDKDRKLVYRGQMDASRPGNGKPNDGADLRAALNAVLAGKSPRRTKSPASAATSSGRPATSRSTVDRFSSAGDLLDAVVATVSMGVNCRAITSLSRLPHAFSSGIVVWWHETRGVLR